MADRQFLSACGNARFIPLHIMQAEFVFDNAPFATCHAATIVPTKQGVMAAWFGGEE